MEVKRLRELVADSPTIEPPEELAKEEGRIIFTP